ncbi:MAG TPA: MBOAT family O-acyltransferase [Chitinivibrionales bacterium]|jgi:alginate O-acetyltransferase complex protein AlgI|nr:MBOAT family O-acyltransferase [Chitinivibrionales bacterium]
MVFSSQIFLFYFLPFFLTVYFLLPFKWKGMYIKNVWITVMSYVFYGWLVPWFTLLLFISSYKDYLCAQIIVKQGITKERRKFALVFAIVTDLLLLGFFKYYMFFMGGVNGLLHICGGPTHTFHILQVLLPSGISFYTFVALSYVIDVYRGDAKQAPSFGAFSCFLGLFPHLIAGPIIRYQSVADQLMEREHSIDKFASGAAIFVLGFAKKILLADTAAGIADAAFGADAPGMLNAWWGVLAYSFQIYFDFCGYSDMAVGLARMMGIEFIKNFNAPYLSKSISIFWKRWHISLSSFIMDYLYIGLLGGNRRGKVRTYINLGLSFFLCGLWHGASTAFVVWGLYQGAFLIIERIQGKNTAYSRAPAWIQVVLTFVIILFGWVVFRAPTLSQAVLYWGAMIGTIKGSASAPLLSAQIFSMRHVCEMAICALFVWQPVQAYEWVKRGMTPAKLVLCGLVFLYAVLGMFTQSFSPFLYFQF